MFESLFRQGAKMRKLRLFVAAPEIPKPDTHSGERRFFALLHLLAFQHQVDLWVKSDERRTPEEQRVRYEQQLAQSGIRLLPYRGSYMSELLAQRYYDIGVFEFYSLAERYLREFRHCQPHAKLIVDSVDVHFAREMLGAKVGVIAQERVEETRHRELAVYQEADAVIAVTEEDREVLLAQGVTTDIYIIPNIVPIRQRASVPQEQSVLFVGGFNHPPNLDGLRWFMQAIWPRVRAMLPEAHFTIIGSHPPAEVYAFGTHPGVTVLGYVPDTAPYLDQAMVSVAPLRYGAGMKGKVNEAMASGVPVVTTSIGAQGLQAISGEHLLIADDAERFADAMIDVLQHPQYAERLGRAGQDLTARLCQPESVEQRLHAMLAEVARSCRKRRIPFEWLKFSMVFHARKILKNSISSSP